MKKQCGGASYDIVCNKCGLICGSDFDFSSYIPKIKNKQACDVVKSINGEWTKYHTIKVPLDDDLGDVKLMLGEGDAGVYDLLNISELSDAQQDDLSYDMDGDDRITLSRWETDVTTHNVCSMHRNDPAFVRWCKMVEVMIDSNDIYNGQYFSMYKYCLRVMDFGGNNEDHYMDLSRLPPDITVDQAERLKKYIVPPVKLASSTSSPKPLTKQPTPKSSPKPLVKSPARNAFTTHILHSQLKHDLQALNLSKATVTVEVEGSDAQKALSILQNFQIQPTGHTPKTVATSSCVLAPPGKVLNPRTNRFIDAKGSLAKKLGLARNSPPKAQAHAQVVLFTGFRDAALKKRIQDRGGQVKESYASDITLVIAKDPKDTSSKLAKARAAGKRIVSLNDAKKMFAAA